MRRIYLDNAATTPLSPSARVAMIDVMEHHHGNPSSIHYFGRVSRSLVEESRKIVAHELKASLGEIFFTSSATEATNTILRNVVYHHKINRIITAKTEHHCVTHTLDYLEQEYDVEVVYLPVDSAGNIDYTVLEELLKQTKNTMVSLMYGNNEIGTIHDVNRIGELCKNYKALFFCDTVQAMAKNKIDVSSTPFSFLTGSAHKFHGPKGVGFFYMNSENIIPPLLYGGAQERNMRAGTENVAGIVGLGAAFQEYVKERDKRAMHIESLRRQFKQMLKHAIPGVEFIGNQNQNYMPHILSVAFPPHPKSDLLMFNLDIAGIAASAGSACSSGIEKASDVLAAINLPDDKRAVRFSFSHLNTLEELEVVTQKLKEILS